MNGLTDRDRVNLFTESADGLEPLALWLTETGMPMRYRGWSKVFERVGHLSEETTRSIYLEPVRGLQLETLLGDQEHPDNTELLARLAERTGLILDTPGQASA